MQFQTTNRSPSSKNTFNPPSHAEGLHEESKRSIQEQQLVRLKQQVQDSNAPSIVKAPARPQSLVRHDNSAAASLEASKPKSINQFLRSRATRIPSQMIDLRHGHSFSHMKISVKAKHDSFNSLPRESSFEEISDYQREKEAAQARVQGKVPKGAKLKKIIPIRGQIKKEGGPGSNIYHLFGVGQGQANTMYK